MSLSQSSRRGGNFSLSQSDELSIHNGPENPELQRVIEDGNQGQSSVETISLVLGSPCLNNLSGMTSCSSNQSFTSSGQHVQASEDEPPSTTGRRIGSRRLCQKLPDVQKEHASVRSTTECSGDTQTSTSRRPVMDVRFFVSRPHNNSTSSDSSSFQQDGREADQCSRWVKRLKQTDSRAHGTRISEIEEPSCRAKEVVAMREITESSKARDVTRKHAWIKRLSPVVSMEKKPPSSMLACETRSSSYPLTDLPGKSIPSIAAMALTGRSMTSFSPCQFRTRGSCTVWNAG